MGYRCFRSNSALPLPDHKFVCTCGSLQCRNAAKHPLAKLAPRGLRDASTDETRVRQWWLAAPSANIGLVTGSVVVLDIDPQHGGAAALTALEERFGELPLTCRAFTGGGGEHIYFRAPDLVGYATAPASLGLVSMSAGRAVMWWHLRAST